MEINQSNRKLIGVLELFTVLVFSLSFVYLLDDVIQVLSLDGVLEDIVFYVFVFGPLAVFPLSLFGWKKLKLKRFGLYTVLASFQIVILIAFTYILMNSQV
ncbi:hypothetical protein [Shewanella salipaludis]|uniref:Uncharacterized protein n=1 Tax=Shewanella salipaludis TaxID=2723052 RepID=A0A972JN51_9GAMM|nr:hypothetical protein [Shewanella salipaludis]NMH67192.1 hypothetical protein [Shewanella salipaludis]